MPAPEEADDCDCAQQEEKNTRLRSVIRFKDLTEELESEEQLVMSTYPSSSRPRSSTSRRRRRGSHLRSVCTFVARDRGLAAWLVDLLA